MSIRIAVLAATLACTGALAQQAPSLLSKNEMKAHKVRIEEQYDHAQMRCKRLQGHARELCNEEARGERDVQAAELQMQASPTPENDRNLRLQKAQSRHALALVKCKSMDGAARELCRSDARVVFTEAQAEAKLQTEVARQTLHSEGTVRERTAQAERIAQAEFNKARERCEMLPGEGRANCLDDARRRFGKP